MLSFLLLIQFDFVYLAHLQIKGPKCEHHSIYISFTLQDMIMNVLYDR